MHTLIDETKQNLPEGKGSAAHSESKMEVPPARQGRFHSETWTRSSRPHIRKLRSCYRLAVRQAVWVATLLAHSLGALRVQLRHCETAVHAVPGITRTQSRCTVGLDSLVFRSLRETLGIAMLMTPCQRACSPTSLAGPHCAS